MGVTDLGRLDGMLFVFPVPSSPSFWMKDTLIPLDIGFFDEDGVLIGVLTMDPCREEPCRGYAVDARDTGWRPARPSPRRAAGGG